MSAPKLCYLCGKPLAKPINRDHVPPDQFFPKPLRKQHELRLLTIDVHQACNTAYKRDEDYFVQSLVPFARGSYSGNALFKKAIADFHAGHNQGLVRKVHAEFDRRPGGIILPRNRVAKRFDGARMNRVAWKLVRGLHFHHTGNVLPADLDPIGVTITPPGEVPPKHFHMVSSTQRTMQDRGQHPGVFAYRFDSNVVGTGISYWAFLLWDRIIMTVMFKPPTPDRASAHRNPSREEWRYEGSFAPDRLAYLNLDPAFDVVAHRIASEAAVTFIDLQAGKGVSVEKCKRPVFRIDVASELRDLFFNGRDGYRGRFWRSRADGDYANRAVIESLMPKLLAALPLEHEPERLRITLSLEGGSAKIWISEPKPDPIADLPRLVAKYWGKVEAHLADALEIKGAFIAEDGAEVVVPDKVDRSAQIHETGWT